MLPQSAHYEVRRTAFRTDDAEVARSDVGSAFARHELHLHDESRLDMQFDGAATPLISAGRLAYGTRTTIVGPAMRNRYHFNVPVRGECAAAQQSPKHRFTAGESAIVFGPDSPFHLEMSADSQQYHFSFVSERFEQHASRLAHTTLDSSIGFDVVCDTSGPAGQSLVTTMRFLYSELRRDAGICAIPAAAHDLESALMTQILMTLPNAVSEMLHAEGRSRRRSRIVDIASHIDEHAGRSITVADLVELSGLSPRALQNGFKAEFEVSPMTYLRNARLDRVRQELRDGFDPVLDVAARWRFFHAGRFARQYRDRFGELPSETRTRAH